MTVLGDQLRMVAEAVDAGALSEADLRCLERAIAAPYTSVALPRLQELLAPAPASKWATAQIVSRYLCRYRGDRPPRNEAEVLAKGIGCMSSRRVWDRL